MCYQKMWKNILGEYFGKWITCILDDVDIPLPEKDSLPEKDHLWQCLQLSYVMILVTSLYFSYNLLLATV